eukprot:6191318-Pleurochrysis_carterae.AAC.3
MLAPRRMMSRTKCESEVSASGSQGSTGCRTLRGYGYIKDGTVMIAAKADDVLVIWLNSYKFGKCAVGVWHASTTDSLTASPAASLARTVLKAHALQPKGAINTACDVLKACEWPFGAAEFGCEQRKCTRACPVARSQSPQRAPCRSAFLARALRCSDCAGSPRRPARLPKSGMQQIRVAGTYLGEVAPQIPACSRANGSVRDVRVRRWSPPNWCTADSIVGEERFTRSKYSLVSYESHAELRNDPRRLRTELVEACLVTVCSAAKLCAHSSTSTETPLLLPRLAQEKHRDYAESVAREGGES